MKHEELFEKRFQGTLSADEARELKRLLAQDEEARREFVRFTQERGILIHLTGRLAEQAATQTRRPAPRPRRSAGGSPWISGAVAAGLFVGVVWLVSSFSSAPPPPARPSAARVEETRVAEREMAEREASERRAREAMARLEEESRRTQERLAAIERDRQQKAVDETRRAEERRRAEEEMARLETRRREAEAAIEKAEAERRKAAEELARKREAEKPAPVPGETVAAAATLESLEGDVLVAGRPAQAGAGVHAGQTLESVNASSRAALRWADGSRIELAGQTTVREVRERDAKKGKGLYVVKGVVAAVVAKQPSDRPMVVATPHGEARIVGTALRVLVSADLAVGTRVEVREGRVRLVRGSDGKGADVSSGQYAVAASGPAPVARPMFTPRIEEAFEAMPAWASTSNAVWGSAGAWSIGPGQGGSALVGARPTAGSSVQALVYPVPAGTRIEVSAAMKCPRFGAGYWAEVGFRLGSHKADDFDVNPKEWTLVKRFDSFGGQNGNGNVWTLYSAQAETGTATQVTVGFKLGAQGSAGPTVAWDSLRISY